jgi:hypothetical protein
MFELNKIEGGLVKSNLETPHFLNEPRMFTNSYFESGLSYEISSDKFISVELENQIIGFIVDEVIIDGITFITSEELKNYLFE